MWSPVWGHFSSACAPRYFTVAEEGHEREMGTTALRERKEGTPQGRKEGRKRKGGGRRKEQGGREGGVILYSIDIPNALRATILLRC